MFRLGATFQNARPIQIVGGFYFYTGGYLFGMSSKHTSPIASSFSCVQQSMFQFFHIRSVRTLPLKIRGPFHFTQAHTQRVFSFPAPFSKLFLRYVVLVTATDFTKPWITVNNPLEMPIKFRCFVEKKL